MKKKEAPFLGRVKLLNMLGCYHIAPPSVQSTSINIPEVSNAHMPPTEAF